MTGSRDGTEIPVPGVKSMDHTADLALEITGPDAPALFRRSALGMMYLLLDRVPEAETEVRRVDVGASDLPGLLREWLRELLYWHETEGFSVSSCEIEELPGARSGDVGARDAADDRRLHLRATVRGGYDDRLPIREIKGVTLHGLAAERRDGGWFGRVVFDV